MRKKHFTLIELSAAMVILVIFMFFLMQFFSTSQDVMNRSSGKTSQYERARLIMDLLANDLQDIFYSEGIAQKVYFQSDDTVSGDTVTEDLSFYALRPQTLTTTKTDLSWVTYHFDSGSYTLKIGSVGDDQSGKWESHLTGSDLGILTDGVYRFRVVPFALNKSGGDNTVIPTADLISNTSGKPRVPDYVRIELQLLDEETALAIREVKKVSDSSTLPDAMNPENAAFTGKDKIRTYFRNVEIDRGQH